MRVRKAVIPAAGWGTRFLPVTKVVPKEALPLIDRPVIQFAVEEAVAAGITEIILVTSHGKRAIEDYFDRSFELERFLEQRGEVDRLQEARALSQMAHISSVRQHEQLGLGHAVLTARALVGEEPFAVFLPDDIIDSPVPAIKQLLDVYEQHGASVLAVDRVADEEVSRWGIIDGEPVGPRTFRVKGLVEKPTQGEAPSNLAVIGRYVLTPEVFDKLEQVGAGAIGEIQLTDGINRLLASHPVYAYEYDGVRHDGGTPLGLLKASVQVGLQRADTGPELRRWLRELPGVWDG